MFEEIVCSVIGGIIAMCIAMSAVLGAMLWDERKGKK